jgi:[ribosomal protein S5]-alanine N-acetyltransferase
VAGAQAAGGIAVRLLTEHDAEALLELRLRNREYFRPSEPSRPRGYFTLQRQREELRRGEEEARERRAWIYGIVLGESALIGRIALSGAIWGPFGSAFLGYAIDEAHSGRGYATQAVGRATDLAFEHGLHRVQAAVVPENAASRRVLEKSGYRYEGRALRYLRLDGRWRDHDIFAVTVEDYEESLPD